MESVHHDSEKMSQYIAAVAVPNSRRFVSVHDNNGQLMLFSLGTDSKLYVSALDPSGNRVIRDLGNSLGFPSAYVAHAFDVVQDAKSKLYISVAIEKSSDPSKSLLYLLQPLGAINMDFSSPDLNLESLIMDGSVSESAKVIQIFMAPAVGKNYSPVVFSFRDEIHHAEDLASASVTMSESGYSWKKKNNVRLPVNAEKVIAVQPVVMKYGSKTIPGHAVLHMAQGKKAIVFMSIDAPHDIDVPLKEPSDPTPADPRALAAVQTPDGFSDLLAGGTGLFRFKAKELAHPGPSKVTDAGVFSSVKDLQVTTSGSGTSVWASNTNNGIGYMMTDTHFGVPDPVAVQVVPDHQGGYFAPFKSTPSACEAFVFANNVGNIAMLEQGKSSQIWKPVPIVQPSLDKVIEVQSYMTQIKPISASGAPLLNHPVILRSSGETSVIVNGRGVVATNAGVAVMTDQSGLLTLTVPTDDISTPKFSVTDASPGSESAKSLAVDPADKINQRLCKIKHKEDLDIDLGPGQGKLLDGTKLTPQEIEEVAGCIHEAMKTRRSFDRGETPYTVPLEDSRGFHAQEIIQGAENGVKRMLWGWWHWLEKQVDKVISFIVNGTIVLVKIGKEIYQLVMETVEHVGKVLSFIFKKIMELGKKLVQWLGYLFKWGDIKDTRDSILNIVQDALEEGPVLLDSLKSKSKDFFESLKHKVSDSRPSEAEMKKLDIKANDASGSKGQSKNPAGNSMAANWAAYQFNHGGGRDASTFLSGAVISDMLSPAERELFDKVDEELKSIQGKHQDEIKSRINQVVHDYEPRGKRSLDAKQAHDQAPTNFLIGCIDGVEKLTDMLLNLIKSIIKTFNGIITAPINVPIFSYLYKTFIRPGHDPTIPRRAGIGHSHTRDRFRQDSDGQEAAGIPRGKFATIIKNLASGKAVPDPEFNKFAAIIGVSAATIAILISIPESLLPVSAELTDQHDQLLFVGQPRPTASLVALADLEVSQGKKKGKVTLDHFLDPCILMYTLHSVPLGDKKPGYTLRLISWVVALFNSTTNIVLHFITALTKLVVNKVRAVLDAILQAVIFALSVAASVLEIITPDWPGKNDGDSALDMASYVFILLGAWSGALERVIKGTNPELELLVKIVKYASYAVAGIMVATKVGIHVSHGNWTDIPFMGDV
ncbi:hypothetical protein X797_010128 [Metarhizium robertsii]|uniref:Uncharacterized protein n=2 Tax=Metarhizium robertsii TaxID=568076 RepID=E9FAQ1_METRA|nr:uncharacterized protein MAA_09350 [Metarhizium robertsii ARSEF 23]EFY95145.2 hypothetical protein MAA_09350 [Metarhizium robertsii ARSEF 23]EXU96731.1 hypothetical protein X797_010128 [Metarhizium robertsii]